MESLCLTGKIEGRKAPGRPREKYMNGIVRDAGGSSKATELLQKRKREEWKSIIANVITGMAHL